MADAVARVCDLFRYSFGADPRWGASAPGRENLIGEPIGRSETITVQYAVPPRISGP